MAAGDRSLALPLRHKVASISKKIMQRQKARHREPRQQNEAQQQHVEAPQQHVEQQQDAEAQQLVVEQQQAEAQQQQAAALHMAIESPATLVQWMHSIRVIREQTNDVAFWEKVAEQANIVQGRQILACLVVIAHESGIEGMCRHGKHSCLSLPTSDGSALISVLRRRPFNCTKLMRLLISHGASFDEERDAAGRSPAWWVAQIKDARQNAELSVIFCGGQTH